MESLPAVKPSRKASILNDEQPYYVDNDSLQRSEVFKTPSKMKSMKKNRRLSQIKYDDVFEKHHIWDYRTDHLTLEAKELIIPRVIRHPIDFEKIYCF